jgi:hypothetical protein
MMDDTTRAVAVELHVRDLERNVRRLLSAASPAEREDLVRRLYLALRDHAPAELRAEEQKARALPADPAERFDR